jgi:hypothetical protein
MGTGYGRKQLRLQTFSYIKLRQGALMDFHRMLTVTSETKLQVQLVQNVKENQ